MSAEELPKITYFPGAPGNGGHWWLTTEPAARRLHAVAQSEVTWDDIALKGSTHRCRAACGTRINATTPVLGERYKMPRCTRCCRALGIPAGDGAPATNKPEEESR
ncbi:MAG TPA: hypothetical protein VIS29_05240 [Streptomyces sp.]